MLLVIPPPYHGLDANQVNKERWTFTHKFEKKFNLNVFEIREYFVQGNRVLVTGSLASRVIATQKLIESEFVFEFTLAQGLITRFRLYEDSYAVAQACQ